MPWTNARLALLHVTQNARQNPASGYSSGVQ